MSTKIKLAFFAEILIEHFDGASRTIFNIIKRIPKERFDVIFYCGVPPAEPFEFPYKVVTSLVIPFNKNYKMAIPHLVYFQLRQHLNDFAPDIIHISSPSALGEFALKYGKRKNIPVATIYHTHFISYVDYYLERLPVLISPIKKWVIKNQKTFYHKCDIVYVPTKTMVSEMESCGFSSHNFKIWPRGIDIVRFNPQKREVSKIQDITGNGYRNILFASRLVWEKNLKTLIKIYKNAEAKSLKLNFIIAGDGVAKDTLQNQMPNAFFLGHLDHESLADVYASCDIFLFTSVTETYGNVVAEAMASGLPCVIANGGGSAHFIEDGINGYLCDPENSEEYLSKIEHILYNEILRNTFIENGLNQSSQLRWEYLTNVYFDDLTYLASADYKQQVPNGVDFSF